MKFFTQTPHEGFRTKLMTFSNHLRTVGEDHLFEPAGQEEDRRLFSIGSLLYLTDLEEVSGQTGRGEKRQGHLLVM